MSERCRCAHKVWDKWHPISCSRPGTLEHEGKMYCKQHHPPSIEARRASLPTCEYVGDGLKCTTIVRGTRFCKWHEDRIKLDRKQAVFAAYARLQAWLAGKSGDVYDEIRQVIAFKLENE